MIDPTRSPKPAWRRYLATCLLTVVVVAAGYFVYTKDLRHHSATATPPAASTSTASTNATAEMPSTTVPGGPPVSGRNPFGG